MVFNGGISRKHVSEGPRVLKWPLVPIIRVQVHLRGSLLKVCLKSCSGIQLLALGVLDKRTPNVLKESLQTYCTARICISDDVMIAPRLIPILIILLERN